MKCILALLKNILIQGQQSRLVLWHQTVIFHYQIPDITWPQEYTGSAKTGSCPYAKLLLPALFLKHSQLKQRFLLNRRVIIFDI